MNYNLEDAERASDEFSKLLFDQEVPFDSGIKTVRELVEMFGMPKITFDEDKGILTYKWDKEHPLEINIEGFNDIQEKEIISENPDIRFI
jgi:hypothetical protein